MPIHPPSSTAGSEPCPDCGKALAADGVCVPCALGAGLAEEMDDAADESSEFFPPTPASLVPGQRVGPYELIEEIARGGMGIVYRARQRAPEREVALKMILPRWLDSPRALERFAAEAEAAASLDGPGILPIHEVGERGGLPYFSMKLAEGGSLAARLPWRPRRTMREAAELVAMLARAVHFAHQRGILHRDLKPGNVLFDAADRPYVSDFGLARSLDGEGMNLTQTISIAGTPQYMAPEQAAGAARLTIATDIYALGVILYELLGGRPPFDGDSALEFLRRSAAEPPRPLRALDPTVPRDLESVCLRCLAKEPSGRYPSAAALAEDLDRWLDGRPTLARPVGPGARLWRWARREPALAAASAALAALTLGSAASLAFLNVRLARERDRARQSEQAANERLRDSLLAQARARRGSAQMGRRFESLRALAQAARLRPGLELRSEAAAALALADVDLERSWPGVRPSVDTPVAFDTTLESYAVPAPGGGVSVRRLRDNSLVASLPGPAAGFDTHLVFGVADDFLAGRYPDGGILLWRMADRGRTPRLVIQGPDTPTEPAFSPDGRRFACADAVGGLTFRDLTTPDPEVVARWEDVPPVRGLCFDPSGTRLALTSVKAGTAQIREAATGRVLASLPHPAGTTLAAWSADGRQLAVSCRDGKVYVWEAATGQLQHALARHTNNPIRPLFHPGGNLLATAGWDAALRFWDPATGRHLFDGPACFDWQRFSPDGTRLAVADYDASVGLYRVADHGILRVLRPAVPQAIWRTNLEASADGRLLAWAMAGGVRVWQLTPGGGREAALLELPGTGNAAPFFVPDGSALLAARDDGPVFSWPLRWSGGAPEFGPRECVITEPGWQPAGALADGRVGLIHAGRGAFRLVQPGEWAGPEVSLDSPPELENISFAADGRRAATGAWHGHDARIWDAATGRAIATLPVGENSRPTFLPDGRVLNVTLGEATLWRSADGIAWQVEHRWKPEAGRQFWTGAAVSPDGCLIALPQSGERIRLVDAVTGQECVALEAPEPLGFNKVRFSADGHFLFALGPGETVGEWDLMGLRRGLGEIGLNW